MNVVEERLADLERRNRRTKGLVAVMAMLAGLAVFLAAAPADRDVQVRSLSQLIGERGEKRVCSIITGSYAAFRVRATCKVSVVF